MYKEYIALWQKKVTNIKSYLAQILNNRTHATRIHFIFISVTFLVPRLVKFLQKIKKNPLKWVQNFFPRLRAGSRQVFALLKFQEASVKKRSFVWEIVEKKSSVGHWKFSEEHKPELVEWILCPGHIFAYLTPRGSYSFIDQIVNNRTVQKGKLLT